MYYKAVKGYIRQEPQADDILILMLENLKSFIFLFFKTITELLST